MRSKNLYCVTSCSFSWHRLLHPPKGGLFSFFLSMKEKRESLFIFLFYTQQYKLFIPSLEGYRTLLLRKF